MALFKSLYCSWIPSRKHTAAPNNLVTHKMSCWRLNVLICPEYSVTIHWFRVKSEYVFLTVCEILPDFL